MPVRRSTPTRNRPYQELLWFTPSDAYSGGYYYPPLPPLYPYPYQVYGHPPGYPILPRVDPYSHNHNYRLSSPPPKQKLHKFLDNRNLRRFYWDMRTPIAKFQCKSSGTAPPAFVLKDTLDEPALGHSTYLRIVCESFEWEIEVKRPKGIQLTLREVLEAIYNAMHEPLKEAEWNKLSVGEKRNAHISRSTRIMWQKASFAVESDIRRIDTLGDKTIFSGLREGDTGDGWLMVLAYRPTNDK